MGYMTSFARSETRARRGRDIAGGFVDNLLAMRAIQRSSLPFIVTLEDYDIFVICAYHFLAGTPLNLKCLLSYEIGSSKTIQRRLDRLKRLRVVCERVDTDDRRTKWLELDDSVVRTLEHVGNEYLEDASRVQSGRMSGYFDGVGSGAGQIGATSIARPRIPTTGRG